MYLIVRDVLKPMNPSKSVALDRKFTEIYKKLLYRTTENAFWACLGLWVVARCPERLPNVQVGP